MKVFLHTRSAGKHDWVNTSEEFEQIPRVGEYIARESGSGWCRVDLVVWLPQSAKTTYLVEVYAVAVDHLEAQKRAHREADEAIARGEH